MTLAARKKALEAIDALVLPDGWDKPRPHRKWERWTHREDPDGQLHLSALGSAPGQIEIAGFGMTLRCTPATAQQALDYVLGWDALRQREE